MRPHALARRLRLLTYLLAGVGLCYLVLRFDNHQLPEQGCSPLLRFAPGDSLLIDRWPPAYAAGDALLFRGSDGLIYLGLVERLRGADVNGARPSLWVVADNPACAGRGSEAFGWIEPDDCLARVVLEWPW